MRLVTFLTEGCLRLGALRQDEGGESVVDLNRADPRLPADMIAFLAAGAEARSLAEEALAGTPSGAAIPLDQVALKAPIPRPGKIICIGLNYRDHAAETGAAVPDYPTVFSKYSNAVVGPGEAIVLPRISGQVDYEAELGVVIGRRAKSVDEGDALDCVAGYLAFNDVSARDFQRRTSQWTIGKTFDTFAPMGPALVTADEVPDPHALDIRLSIGGEVLQSSNTCNLIFTVPKLVAYLSAVMTLEPGDVIATGTPGGVGFVRRPPRWLRPGEVVRIEIGNLGVLENPVVAEG
ncbi:MAG: fumarylacetoacetate hydrolase family protein [Anaerolineae bacterium]|nr:fumarylacetoacetate hydrolase family protein [Anaerolineae bacterium]